MWSTGDLTVQLLLACCLTGLGAVVIGYNGAVVGGVSAMPGYLHQFFPEVLAQEAAGSSVYCRYNNQGLQLVVASLYLSGIVSALPAGYLVRRLGRIGTLRACGPLFIIGIVLQAAAQNTAMLVLGGLVAGVASTTTNVAIIIYSAEMAPPRLRARMGFIYQAAISLGVVIAQGVNSGVQDIYPWGWRLSIALAAIPGCAFLVSAWLLPDTPTSLFARGHPHQAQKVLQWIRHREDVDKELAMHEAEACLTSRGPCVPAPQSLLVTADMESHDPHTASQPQHASGQPVQHAAISSTHSAHPVISKSQYHHAPGQHGSETFPHMGRELHSRQPQHQGATPAESQQEVLHPESESPAAQSPTAADACLGQSDGARVRAQDSVGGRSTSADATQHLQQRVAWHTILTRRNRPQLLLPAACTFFQIWSGFIIMCSFAPQLLVSLGIPVEDAQILAIGQGAVNHISVYPSMWLSDRYGRRSMLLIPSAVMLACQASIGIALAIAGPTHTWVAWLGLAFFYTFSAAFNMSWGPIGNLYPAEICTIETRATCQAIAVLGHNLWSFVVGQTFLTMLCSLRWGLFLFFSAWMVTAMLVVYMFFPETKHVPLSETRQLFSNHWFWQRFGNSSSGSAARHTASD